MNIIISIIYNIINIILNFNNKYKIRLIYFTFNVSKIKIYNGINLFCWMKIPEWPLSIVQHTVHHLLQCWKLIA